jgi:hypothetical protein
MKWCMALASPTSPKAPFPVKKETAALIDKERKEFGCNKYTWSHTNPTKLSLGCKDFTDRKDDSVFGSQLLSASDFG